MYLVVLPKPPVKEVRQIAWDQNSKSRIRAAVHMVVSSIG